MDVTTELWQRVAGQWKLRLLHTTPIPTPPPAQILSASDAASLIGRYRAAGETVSLTAVDGGISWRVEGRPTRLLLAEARDVLFEPNNSRVRYIFQRNAAGAVVAVLRRNENRAIRYVRLP